LSKTSSKTAPRWRGCFPGQTGTQFPTLSLVPAGDKEQCAEYFAGCRAGGQTFNSGTTDLNALKAFFIEQSRDNPDAIKATIDANTTAGGWLVFGYPHVCDSPTRYGAARVVRGDRAPLCLHPALVCCQFPRR
jgi:hypothetical protein